MRITLCATWQPSTKATTSTLCLLTSLTVAPEEEIARLARFLGKDLSMAQIAAVKEKATFKSMKAEEQAEEEAKGKGKGGKGEGREALWSQVIWCKGVCGDGAATLSPEMAAKIDAGYGKAMAPIQHLFPVC